MIGGLNDQITFRQSQAHASVPPNDTVDENQMMQVMLQLQNEVRALKNQQTIPILAQPPIIPIDTPGYATPVSNVSACAGIDPNAPSSPKKPKGFDGGQGGRNDEFWVVP